KPNGATEDDATSEDTPPSAQNPEPDSTQNETPSEAPDAAAAEVPAEPTPAPAEATVEPAPAAAQPVPVPSVEEAAAERRRVAEALAPNAANGIGSVIPRADDFLAVVNASQWWTLPINGQVPPPPDLRRANGRPPDVVPRH